LLPLIKMRQQQTEHFHQPRLVPLERIRILWSNLSEETKELLIGSDLERDGSQGRKGGDRRGRKGNDPWGQRIE
jgi:hypothetical protein